VTLGSHQRTIGRSQDHITPKYIIDMYGPFKLDPCAAVVRPWDCAEVNWTSDGLVRNWRPFGMKYVNPPFNQYEVGDWIAKAADEGNVHLVPARSHPLLSAGWKSAATQFGRTADPGRVRRGGGTAALPSWSRRFIGH